MKLFQLSFARFFFPLTLLLFLLSPPIAAPALALSIDATVSTDGSALKRVVSPPLSTRSTNQLLLAFVAAGNPSATAPATRVTGVSGGRLTWVLVQRTNAQRGTAEIWRSFASTPLTNVKVTATLNQAVPSASITVVSFVGVDSSGTNGSGAIGATATASSAAGAPSASLITTRDGSWVFGVGMDADSATSRVPAVGEVMMHEYLAPSADTLWVQRQEGITPSAGTTVTISDTAPATDRFNLTLVEVRGPAIQPTAPVASILPPELTFGTQEISTTSAPLMVTIGNTGTATLSVTGVQVTGDNQSDFVPAGACGSVAAGGTCTIAVTFTPGAAGARSATLAMATNDPTHPILTVYLSGTGVSAAAGPVIGTTVSVDRSAAATSITTPSLTTRTGNQLLLALVSADSYVTGPNTMVTGITNSGTPLTWTLVRRTNAELGTAEVWRAFAPATFAGTVTVSFNQSVPASSVTVVTFSGVDTSGIDGSSAIGASVSASSPAGAPWASLITTRDNSWVFGVGTDWDTARARTLGPNQTMVHQYLATVGDTYWVQRQTAVTPLSGTTVTINDTAPANDRYNLTLVEVRGPGFDRTRVNSLADLETPPAGTVTLRSALNEVVSGGTITFDPALNGQTIQLSLIGATHTILKGEIYGADMTFQGYGDRDYGKSALYAKKDVVIDASPLTDGIVINWNGGDASHARVLALDGNLTMKNVTISSGYSSAEALTGGTQPYTLARGGGLAVWGTVTLEKCIISGNRAAGDLAASRDRGTYGGGIYANGLNVKGSVISGNRAIGYGAAGGGIYSVGGADNTTGVGNTAVVTATTISGNRVTGQHAYGGGIFSLAGGPNNLAWLQMTNSTVARNLVEDHPDLPEAGQYYYRGGGVYLGGGSLSLVSCTVAENEVVGPLAVFSGKPNRGGGGVAATIGNAHVVENVLVQHSIVTGNRVNGAAADWYSGSLLYFSSNGYNRIGILDFSQILVPVPDWMDLSRKHYPKVGDLDGVTADQVLGLGNPRLHGSIISAGVDAGSPALLWYSPAGSAVNQIPDTPYQVTSILAGYTGFGVVTDDFLNQVLAKLRTEYSSVLGSDFGTGFGDLTGVTWYGPGTTWPSNPQNGPWITFWRDLDTAIAGRLGAVNLGDGFWGSFANGPIGNEIFTANTEAVSVNLIGSDQVGAPRPAGGYGDIGAIETVP